MNKSELDKLLEKYFAWLKNKTISKEIDSGWAAISTPFLDRHNDYLQIYAKQEKEKIRLSDGGYIIDDLEMCGCFLDSPHRKKILETTLRGLGVSVNNSELFTLATENTFPEKKHALVQAMLAVNDLFYTASSHVLSLFVEDVMTWFDSIDVRYMQKVKFQGKSGFDNMFEFAIPKSKKHPERIIQTVSNPDKKSVENIVFKWLDTRENRPEETRLFAFINDTETQVSSQITDALENYDIQPMAWSKRYTYTDLLTA